VVKPLLGPTTTEFDAFSALQIRRLLTLALGAAPLSGDVQDPVHAGRLLAVMLRERGGTDERLLEVVAAPGTSLKELRRIKDLAKELLESASGADDRDAVRLLYHAAVAAALGGRGVDISTRPLETRRAIYRRLAEAFIEHPLGAIFTRAADRADSNSNDVTS
jgi:hypothetical protein